MASLEDIRVVTGPSKSQLNERQLLDYRSQREACLKWLLTFGKNPEKVEGYAHTTVENRANRIDIFYRWVWAEEGKYTASITHDHADAYMRHLAYKDSTNADKANHQKAIQMLFKWRHHEHSLDEWNPPITFSDSSGTTTPRDYLTREERSLIREAALEYGSIPSYKSVSPRERDQWKAHLAQRFEKPKDEITQEDWNRANGWKVPSLVWVSLDTGLRPIEVQRAVTSWVDIDNRLLRIPREESSKNVDHWKVGLTQRSAKILDRWLQERQCYEAYDESDHIWLTRQRNPYKAASLRYVIRRLCEVAGIPIESRQMSWYSIRHSVGTYMTREEDLAAAQAQLRHKSPQTTMKYDQVPVEDRQNALERMG